MTESVKKLIAKIESIQKKCKHSFILKNRLDESNVKDVFAEFIRNSDHVRPFICSFGFKAHEATCKKCELEIEFSGTVRCPKCFKRKMRKTREGVASKYVGNTENCDCVDKYHKSCLYKCKSCGTMVVSLEVDQKK